MKRATILAVAVGLATPPNSLMNHHPSLTEPSTDDYDESVAGSSFRPESH